jgi:cytoskeletal protein CcmA (bactofilin family)
VLIASPVVPIPVSAKTPGGLHCYRLVCHRVMTLTETYRLVGSTRTMITSYYDDPRFDRYNTGQLTSSGERFDAGNSGRAASSVFPDGTELLLWNASNGRAAHVVINDFGPFLGSRTLDITKSLAERLDITRKGVVDLRVTVIASPSTNQSRYRRLRVYPKVAGYLGIYGASALATLAGELVVNSRRGEAEPAVRVTNIPLPQRKPMQRGAPSIRTALLTIPFSQIRIADPPTLRPQPPMESATLLSPAPLHAGETLPTNVVVVVASDSDRSTMQRLLYSQSPDVLAAMVVISLLAATFLLIQRSSRASKPSRLTRAVASPALQTKPPAVSCEGPPAVAQFTPPGASFIGRDLQVSGELVTYNDLVLAGRMDGDCVCRRLTIKVGGMLNGDIVAEEVLIAGSVTGKILAKIVGVDSHAAVSGEIIYCDLIVERNRLFDVTCHKISMEAWRRVQSSTSESKSNLDGATLDSQQTLRGSLHEVRF